MVGPAEVVKLVLPQPQAAPEAAETLVDQLERKGVVAGSDRRVHGKQRRRRHQFLGLSKGEALCDVLTDKH